MVRFIAASALLTLILASLTTASPTPKSTPRLFTREDCSAVGPSPPGPPCSDGPLTCETIDTWSCPNGDTGVVPPGTECHCNAFRHPGWVPNNNVSPECTTGIVCEGESQFRVCGVSGIEPPQDVAPGTKCENGAITFA